jgi:hypothetical protein
MIGLRGFLIRAQTQESKHNANQKTNYKSYNPKKVVAFFLF